MRVTQFGARAESLGKTGLHVHHYLHALLGGSLIEACQLVHLLHMQAEGFADFGGSLVVLQIVFALAHAQTCLIGLHGVHAAVHLVGTDIEHVVGNDALLLHVAQQGIEFLFVLQGGKLVQFLLDGSHTVLVQLHAVHDDFVEVTDFLCHAAGFMRSGSQFLDKALNLLAVVFRQDGEGTVLRVFGRNRIVLHPSATGVLVEVTARHCRRVKIGKLDACCQFSLLLAGVAGCCHEAEGCKG